MTYKRLAVSPVSGAMGAEIGGVDLANLDDETFAEVKQAFRDHLVIMFRDQNMTPEQLLAFGRRFGDLDIAPFVKGMDDYPAIIEVVKTARDEVNFGGAWHSDFSFKREPPLGSILYAREVPAVGGDTMFSNLHLAYETLSSGMKDMLDGLTAIHSPRRSYSAKAIASRRRAAMTIEADETSESTWEHPFIRVHADTGRRCLFINDIYTIGVKGWSEAESRPLLKFLGAHAVKPEFTCRLRWQKDSVAFWDNRCVLHNALNDYSGHRRHMQRVTVVGEVPLGVSDMAVA